MRYAVIIAQKCPIFVIFRPPDQENFDVGLHGTLGKRFYCDSAPPVSCSSRWNSSHAENMHSHIILHGRLPGISKEGQMLLLSMIVKTCVISLISNHVKQSINNHQSPSPSLHKKVGESKSDRHPKDWSRLWSVAMASWWVQVPPSSSRSDAACYWAHRSHSSLTSRSAMLQRSSETTWSTKTYSSVETSSVLSAKRKWRAPTVLNFMPGWGSSSRRSLLAADVHTIVANFGFLRIVT